ncbi:hypothetical protein Gorai_022377, partial [Gossypium raimondii]|nr:hypothetical protein [Gossypium raimondii]
MDMLTQINNVLEPVVEALKKEMDELKGELVLCNAIVGNDMLIVTPRHKIEVPKSKKFQGCRDEKRGVTTIRTWVEFRIKFK